MFHVEHIAQPCTQNPSYSQRLWIVLPGKRAYSGPLPNANSKDPRIVPRGTHLDMMSTWNICLDFSDRGTEVVFHVEHCSSQARKRFSTGSEFYGTCDCCC